VGQQKQYYLSSAGSWANGRTHKFHHLDRVPTEELITFIGWLEGQWKLSFIDQIELMEEPTLNPYHARLAPCPTHTA
jgi:hypothetical protein